ncbi:MAG: ribosome biogenesis GTPase YlqF [Lachnospiraceae bacterium]|nr:ribosome biogenesis GTPase YlqF [Lachnospiraceae bacterium]
MNIQWYPGHMTKALRQMKDDIRLVDLVIELVDARIPFSSRNPDIGTLTQGKSRIIILGKSDLADSRELKKWTGFFERDGLIAIPMDARKNTARAVIRDKCFEACAEKIERDRRRGIKNRPVRAMIAGIPNVGKSTFINSFAGRAGARTGDKPGVTKGNQWIRIDKQLELLDTPGILWPKFEDQAVGRNLALVGSINDDVVSREELCDYLVGYLNEYYPDNMNERYGGNTLDAVCERLGCLAKGGEYDYERGRIGLLDDFRSGRLGKINLEVCHE